MRSAPKIRRVKLKVGQKDDSVLLGIVTAEADYKISLALNRNLGISLKNRPPVILNDDTGNEILFSRFSDSSDSTNLSWDLISNRSGKNHLVRKLKNIDYILRIQDPDNVLNIEQAAAALRVLDCITALFTLDAATIKDKNLIHLIH